jgi:glycogenin glucosyltransferase
VKAYICVLTSDNYHEGVLVLARSLAATRPAFPLYALLTADVAESVRARLEKAGLICLRSEKSLEFPATAVTANRMPHWNKTLSKLLIFDLVQFEKLVYLDADMMILSNIDNLFEAPNLSAVNAGGMLEEFASWRELNSGLLVIEPRAGLSAEILAQLPAVIAARDMFGDQDLINFNYPSWPQNTSLHLPHGYNMLVQHADRYRKRMGFSASCDVSVEQRIYIVHFAMEKPWLQSYRRLVGDMLHALTLRNWVYCYFMAGYLGLLLQVRLRGYWQYCVGLFKRAQH